ncbi:hypothetical protein FACS1894125_1530 [Actinomycetota bacterium]|nr:hypothetical protein FACS1894125_1530 [Actinomycetota bacterium]
MVEVVEKFRELTLKKLLLILGSLLIAGVPFFIDSSQLGLVASARLVTIVLALCYLAHIDFYTHRVPNFILLVLLGIRGVIYIIQLLQVQEFDEISAIFVPDLLTALVFAGFFFLVAFLTRGGMGMGDIKLLGVISLYLGFKMTFLSLIFGMIISFIVAVVMMVAKKKKRDDVVPFVPFLAFGVFVGVNIVVLGVI